VKLSLEIYKKNALEATDFTYNILPLEFAAVIQYMRGFGY